MGLFSLKIYAQFFSTLGWFGMVACALAGSLAAVFILTISHPGSNCSDDALWLRWKNLKASLSLACLLGLVLAFGALAGIDSVPGAKQLKDTLAAAEQSGAIKPYSQSFTAVFQTAVGALTLDSGVRKAISSAASFPSGASGGCLFLVVGTLNIIIVIWLVMAAAIQVLTPKVGITLKKTEGGKFEEAVPLERLDSTLWGLAFASLIVLLIFVEC